MWNNVNRAPVVGWCSFKDDKFPRLFVLSFSLFVCFLLSSPSFPLILHVHKTGATRILFVQNSSLLSWSRLGFGKAAWISDSFFVFFFFFWTWNRMPLSIRFLTSVNPRPTSPLQQFPGCFGESEPLDTLLSGGRKNGPVARDLSPIMALLRDAWRRELLCLSVFFLQAFCSVSFLWKVFKDCLNF